jgi:methionine-rich copper-binding protein CopC
MSVKNAPAAAGKSAASALLKQTRKEEKQVEAETGRPLKKGAARVEERSKSSDGKSAGTKQNSK